MQKASKVLIVTAGLVVTGAVVGAICGMVGLATSLAVQGESPAAQDLAIYAFAGVIGAFVGSIIAPLLAWGLLRYVPIGRAVAQCALGTTLGGMVAFTLEPNASLFVPVLGALFGFVAAAVRLRIATPRSELALPHRDARQPSAAATARRR